MHMGGWVSYMCDVCNNKIEILGQADLWLDPLGTLQLCQNCIARIHKAFPELAILLRMKKQALMKNALEATATKKFILVSRPKNTG